MKKARVPTPQKVHTIWFRLQKILENACCCLWIVGKGSKKDWGKGYKGTQGTQAIFWLCWSHSLPCLWWWFLRYIHMLRHNTFYTLHMCSLFHVNHTSIKLLRTKLPPKIHIYHPSLNMTPVNYFGSTISLSPQFRKVSPASKSAKTGEQWSPSPLPTWGMLAGSKKSYPGSFFCQCGGSCLCSDGHNVSSPGR